MSYLIFFVAERYQETTKTGTNTNRALVELEKILAFSYDNDDNHRKRHVLVLTDGRFNLNL